MVCALGFLLLNTVAIDYFAEHTQKGERFAKTLERLGWDGLREKVEGAFYGNENA